jgi:hypothetical protein
MKGYERTPEMTEKLIEAISCALRANPSLRLGQLIWHKGTNQGEGTCDIPDIYDEKWIKKLQPKEQNDNPNNRGKDRAKTLSILRGKTRNISRA